MKLLILLGSCCISLWAAKPVLIIADGAPIRILAVQLKAHGIASETVSEDAIPASLSSYPAVFVYLHKALAEPAEKAFIAYANAGGKLIVLHHSISSQKRQNPTWLDFLGVKLPEGDVAQGGYKYYDPVNLTLVNLAPKDWITTHDVRWQSRAEYRGEDRDAMELPATEVYLNHVLDGPRTVLLGLKFREEKSGVTYQQDTAGWYKKAGKGSVMYFMAGHSGKEFEDPVYAQILVNAVNYRP
jgi:Trehalose utilisation